MRPRHLLLLVVAFTLSAQQQPPAQPPAVQGQIYVTAVDVVVDVRDKAGNVPAGLQPADFTVLEDGVPRTVVGAQYLRRGAPAQGAAGTWTSPDPKSEGPAWQLVLYFETELSSDESRKTSAQELIKTADVLASKGSVDVILADPTPHALVRNSRDPEAIRQALRKVMAASGANQLALNRRRFIDDANAAGAVQAQRNRVKTEETPDAGAGSGTRSAFGSRPSMDLGTKNTTSPTGATFDVTGAQTTNVTLTTIRPYIQQEVQLISRFRTNLIGWLAAYGRHTPRTLMLMTDGFDVDPLEYYKAYLSDRSKDASIDEIAKLSDNVAKTGQTLAAAGWTTVSVPGNNSVGFGAMDDASTSSTSRMNNQHQLEMTARNQGMYHPRVPLERFAEMTGGSVLANSGKIAAAVNSIDDRILVTYQVDRRPDGKPHKIQVQPRDKNLLVRTTQWSPATTPEEISETRAMKALQAAPAAGDFPVEATVEWNAPGATKNGTMRVVAKVDAIAAFLPANHRGDFRVTMAVQVAPGRASAVNSVMANYDLSEGAFRFRAPVNVPPSTTAISLVIEELNTGLSGVTTVQVP